MKNGNVLRANLIILGITIFFVITSSTGINYMLGPLTFAAQTISLDLYKIPEYILRSTMRITVAIFFSIVIGFIYALLAAKNRRIGFFLIPLLDIFQSIPVLGYLSFTVTAFIAMAPGKIFGVEMAIIFAIFTAQVWNLIFSIYQSLMTVPLELYEAAKVYKLNKWQVFWQIELPFAVPGIIWNIILSMSSSWFFIVAAEAISVGNQVYSLPGIGIYIAMALKNSNIEAIFYAILAILGVIVLFNILIFAPLVAWSHKFRYEFNMSNNKASSWVYDCFVNASVFNMFASIFTSFKSCFLKLKLPKVIAKRVKIFGIFFEIIWWGIIIFCLYSLLAGASSLFEKHISVSEVFYVIKLGFFSLMRVLFILLVASIIWVPLGVFISLRPKMADKIQPLIQFLTALPANTYFPIFVIGILYFQLNPEIWLSFMMMVGAQWYVLYNVIAGGKSIPTEILEAGQNFQLKGFKKWKSLFLPAIFPYYVTGLITASGGAWNASIVSEIITWGNDTVKATGLGAYIAENTNAGNFAQIAMGVIVMACYVVIINYMLWKPLYRYASNKFKLG